MEAEKIIRKVLHQKLKEQETRSRKIRHNKKASVFLIWSEISLCNYPSIIRFFLEQKIFDEFMNEVKLKEERQKIWNAIPDTSLGMLLGIDTTQTGKIISQMSEERQKRFLNNGGKESLYSVFWAIEMPEKIRLIGMISQEKLREFLDYISDKYRDFEEFLGQFCAIEDYEGGKEVVDKIFVEIANMPFKKIAQILESAASDVVCNIFQRVYKPSISAIFREITTGKLYEVLTKCNFFILEDANDMPFPLERMSNEEKQELFTTLKKLELDICNIFCIVGITELYGAIDIENKEYILDQLTNLGTEYERLSLFYSLLPREGKRDTIEILAKSSQKSFAIQLLEEDKKGFWEEAGLKELKSGNNLS